MLKNQFVKYLPMYVENFLGGDMKSLFMNTKKQSSFNFKPMIPEQFHGIAKGIDSNDYYLNYVDRAGLHSWFYRRFRKSESFS
jgi:mevalonate kinase